MFNFDIFSTGSSHIASSQADQVKKTRVVGSRGQAALPASSSSFRSTRKICTVAYLLHRRKRNIG